MGRNTINISFINKKPLKGILFIAFLWYIQIPHALIHSQRLNFDKYSVEDGLAQSVVLTIYQDSEGYLWFGTQSGISQFNGYGFVNFQGNIQSKNTLTNAWIYDIAEDTKGNLYFATKGGLNRYDKATGSFSCIGHLDENSPVNHNFIYGLVTSGDTLFVNSSPALSVIDMPTRTFETFYNDSPYDGIVHDLGFPIIKSAGNLIYIGSSHGLSSFNLETKTFTNYTGQKRTSSEQNNQIITALYEDIDGTILVGMHDGLKTVDTSSHTFKNASDINQSLPNSSIRSMLRDDDDYLWIATEGDGLHRVGVDKHYNVKSIEHYRAGENSISHDILYTLLLDHSNNLWVGSLAGTDKVNLKESGIQVIANNTGAQSVDIMDNVVASIYIDDKNRLWIGNWGKGLNIYDRKTGEITYYTADRTRRYHIPEDHVHVIFEDSKKRIWIGTRNGVAIFNREKELFVPAHEWFENPAFNCFNNIRVYSIMEDHNGKIWIGTGNGIYILDMKNRQLTTMRGGANEGSLLKSNLVYALLKDSEDEVWIATSEGVHRYDQQTGEITVYRSNPDSANTLSNNFTISLYEDSIGYIWIGTGLGLSRFSKETGKFEGFSTQHGLPSNIVYDIIEDQQHNLWFSTGSGLAWIKPEEKISGKFNVIDKLRGQEFNIKAIYHSKHGEMFFGGINGLFHFYPDSLSANKYIPPVKITSIVKENDESTEPLNPYQDEITLSYRDYAFTIAFSALDYTNPGKNRYAYQMEGLSDKWIETGERRSVHFTNLPSGSYTFRVKGSNNDGVWNEKPTSLDITIKPPWWLSTVAYTGYGIFLIVAIIFIIKYRERALRREKQILEDKVRERTAEIDRQKKQVEESEQKLSSTINSLDDMVFVLDDKGIITEIYNPALRKNRVYFPELKVGQDYSHINFSEDTVSKINQAYQQLSKEETILEFDHHVNQYNRFFWYNTKISPKRNAEGHLTGLVIVARDITERKESEKKLAQQKEELNELNITKDRFFSILAHDLKNPFTNLYSMGDLLVKNYESLDEKDRWQALKKMHQASEFIYSLLENLLTWSRTQTNKIDFNPEAFDLSKIIEINANLQHIPAETKGVKIINKVKGIRIAYGDREMISTVIRNLLNNAVKYTRQGGRVTIDTDQENEHYTVRINDEGVGISAEDQEKLFRLDVKYKKKGTAGETGTGLGLALCKEFVLKNRGNIWCRSRENIGTTFYFTVAKGNGEDNRSTI